MGAPNGEHHRLIGTFYRLLFAFVIQKELGIVMLAPFDVVVCQEPLRTRQPDLFFLRKERGGTPENLRRLK